MMKRKTHSQTSLATIGAIVILQGTDHFIVGIGDREGAGQRASGRHGAYGGGPSLGEGAGGKWERKRKRKYDKRGERAQLDKGSNRQDWQALSLFLTLTLVGKKEKKEKGKSMYIEGLDPPSS